MCSAAFGCTTDHHRCIALIAPATLLSSCGRHLVFHNLETEKTTFLEVPEPNVISTSAAVLSASGKYAALLQTITAPHLSNDPSASSTLANNNHADVTPTTLQQVAVYSLKAGKLSRAITPRNMTPGATVVDFGFSSGLSKNLFISWGGPEPLMAVYRWYSCKECSSTTTPDFTCAAFDPTSELNLIGVAGPTAYRLEQDIPAGALIHRRLHTFSKVRICSAAQATGSNLHGPAHAEKPLSSPDCCCSPPLALGVPVSSRIGRFASEAWDRYHRKQRLKRS